jgi:hypothetical protein
VVGEAARLELLVEDYAGEEARGGDHAAWLERMEASALRLQKRCTACRANLALTRARARALTLNLTLTLTPTLTLPLTPNPKQAGRRRGNGAAAPAPRGRVRSCGQGAHWVLRQALRLAHAERLGLGLGHGLPPRSGARGGAPGGAAKLRRAAVGARGCAGRAGLRGARAGVRLRLRTRSRGNRLGGGAVPLVSAGTRCWGYFLESVLTG